MLELIFQGFAEWIYSMILECWEYFASSLLEIMSLDFAYLKSHIPAINDIMQTVLAVGWALLLGNLVFQAARSMLSGIGFEGEDPKLLFTRTFVFAFLLLASPQICELGLSITSNIMTLLDIPDAVDVHLVDSSLFGSLSASWLLVIIFDLILMFKVLKLLVEIAERHVILSMLTIMAPMAFATGGSRSTSDIFSGWCRMYGSMCGLMCTNIIFFKMLLSVVSSVPSGIDVFPWMVLILAIVKVAKKADAIITRIGLNPAITGDNLGSRLPGMLTYAVVRTMVSNVTKAASKSAGNTKRGRGSSGSPPNKGGSGPRGSGPFGRGHGGATARGTQQKGSRGGVQQGTTYQSNAQTTAQQGTPQTGGQKPAPEGQGSGSTVSPLGRTGSTGRKSSRKSSVAPETHRSPSHVSAAGNTIFGTPVAGKPGTAGMPTESRSFVKLGAVQPGSAGTLAKASNPAKSGAVKSGVTGHDKPGTPTRYTQVTSQRVQGGDSTAEVRAAEHNNITAITAPQRQTPPQTAQPGPQSPNTTSGRKAQPEATATHFTRRDSRGTQAKQVPTTSTASPTSSGVQLGKAGKGIAPVSTHSTTGIRQDRKATSPASGAIPTAQKTSGTVQQKPGKTDVPTAPHSVETVAQTRPGMAGTVPADSQAAQTRQTARGQTVRGKSTPVASGSRGGKKATSTASAVQKGQSATKGVVPPKKQASMANRTARSPRKDGGAGHGK